MSSALIPRLLQWIFERAAELVLMSWLLFLMFGATTGVSNELGDNIVRNGYLVAYAMIASGYVLTTGWLARSRGKRGLYLQAAAAVGLYLLHAVLFLRQVEWQRLWILLVAGSSLVALVSALGTVLYSLAMARLAGRQKCGSS